VQLPSFSSLLNATARRGASGVASTSAPGENFFLRKVLPVPPGRRVPPRGEQSGMKDFDGGGQYDGVDGHCVLAV
jgi:hypothetical protein